MSVELKTILKSMDLNFFGNGKHKITSEKLFGQKNSFLLDVRSEEEAGLISLGFKSCANVESVNIPINMVPERINEIPKDKTVAVFCPASVRASMVYLYLLSEGYEDVYVLEGGYSALTDAAKPGKALKMSL